MATPEEVPAPAAESSPYTSLSPAKIIGIGAGAFLLQIAIVYLLIALFLVPKITASGAGQASPAEAAAAQPESHTEGQFVFVVKDLIINPAGTGGTRFLMATVGVETASDEELKSIEKKDVLVRDVLNTILASKTIEMLDDQTRREGLRREIRDSLQRSIHPEKISQVYFSKFIIQ